MFYRISLAGLCVTSLVLAACASDPEARMTSDEKVAAALEEMDLERQDTVERIPNYRIDSWRYIDDYHLIIEAGLREQYLVEFNQPCIGLSSAIQIGFTDTAGGLTRFDRIVVEAPGFRRNEICHIQDIVRLADRR